MSSAGIFTHSSGSLSATVPHLSGGRPPSSPSLAASTSEPALESRSPARVPVEVVVNLSMSTAAQELFSLSRL